MPREITAYHEAGHFVAGWLCRVKLSKVSIQPDRELGISGYVTMAGGDNPLWAYLCLLAGGAAAERYYQDLSFGGSSCIISGSSKDWEGVIAALNQVYKTDIKPTDFDEPALLAGDKLEAYTVFFEALEETDELLLENWPEVEALARRLLQKETLSGNEAGGVIICSLASRTLASKFPEPIARRIEPALFALRPVGRLAEWLSNRLYVHKYSITDIE